MSKVLKSRSLEPQLVLCSGIAWRRFLLGMWFRFNISLQLGRRWFFFAQVWQLVSLHLLLQLLLHFLLQLLLQLMIQRRRRRRQRRRQRQSGENPEGIWRDSMGNSERTWGDPNIQASANTDISALPVPSTNQVFEES